MKLLNSFKIKSTKVTPDSFNELALELFQFQAEENEVYKEYIHNLGISSRDVKNIKEIPFLPIDFFKNQLVKTGNWKEEEVFKSSGTEKSIKSNHYIEDSNFYLTNAKRIYESYYKSLAQSNIFALLPSYQEQGHSSLVKMVSYFIEQSDSSPFGGFYLNKIDVLLNDLIEALKVGSNKVILFGVGYALLDLVELAVTRSVKLDGLTIIETGGMKGRRKDMVKKEFYHILKKGLGNIQIVSEYGMTELLSQAYSNNEVSYQLPNQMQALIRQLIRHFVI